MSDVACDYINVVRLVFQQREALINAQGNIALAGKMKTKRKRWPLCTFTRYAAQNQTDAAI